MDENHDEYPAEAEREFEYRAREVVRNQRFSRRPKTTARLLSQVISRRGFAETRRNEQLEKIWLELVGEQLARQTRLGQIRKGVLQVYLSNATAKHSFSMNKQTLLEDLKRVYPVITDIRFKVGN